MLLLNEYRVAPEDLKIKFIFNIAIAVDVKCLILAK